jgi:hypothetical protein
MTCRDVREIAGSSLAGELPTDTKAEILLHLETCPACRADFAAQRALRGRLQRAIQNAPDLDPRPEFMLEVRTRLRDAAYQAPARRVRAWGHWTLAATVLLAVALGLSYLGREWSSRTNALARAAIGDHRNCALAFRLADKPISLEEAARRYGAMYRALERMPGNDIATAAGPAHVLARHACVYGGRRFAHIVLEYRGVRVSLLVTAADGGLELRFPFDARPHVTSPGRIDDMSVISFRASHQMVFLVGDIAPAQLGPLADALAGPLYHDLTSV